MLLFFLPWLSHKTTGDRLRIGSPVEITVSRDQSYLFVMGGFVIAKNEKENFSRDLRIASNIGGFPLLVGPL